MKMVENVVVETNDMKFDVLAKYEKGVWEGSRDEPPDEPYFEVLRIEEYIPQGKLDVTSMVDSMYVKTYVRNKNGETIDSFKCLGDIITDIAFEKLAGKED